MDAARAGRRSVLHRLSRALAALGVLILLACAVLTVTDIVGRRLLGFTIHGMVDLTQLLVMAAVFMWIPYAFECRANVEVDLLFDRLPAPARRWLDRLWPLFGAGFLFAVAAYATQAAMQVLEYGDQSATLGIPMIWYWGPLVFGTLFAGVVCIAQFFAALGDPQAGARRAHGGPAA